MLRSTIPMFLLVALLLATSPLYATEKYAEQTGRDCGICHLDPSGGGELTPQGTGFALSFGADLPAAPGDRPVTGKLFRLLIGYLHILFAFFWFGTILYVHLILKPAYASRGLPRGEVKLGLAAMVIMGITGAILFSYRVPDASLLLESRFGILLLAKIILYLIMVLSALFAVFFIGPRLKKRRGELAEFAIGEMSLTELEQHDGRQGRRAYFAYRGEIYDATDSPLWKSGVHMGRHPAGSDLTDALGQAPHGEEKVLPLPKVGRLRSGENKSLTLPQRVFYTIAYVNLGFVLLIVLILACWKWW